MGNEVSVSDDIVSILRAHDLNSSLPWTVLFLLGLFWDKIEILI